MCTQALQLPQVLQVGIEAARVALGVDKQVNDGAIFDLEPELMADQTAQIGDRLLLL